MFPVFIVLVCFIVGSQCTPAPPHQLGEQQYEGLRLPEPAGDKSRLPRDTANQKWIRRIDDYARTQMTQGLGLLSPFRLNLPLGESDEALPVLVLPVPIYGGCKDVKNRLQSDSNSVIITDEYPQRQQANTNNDQQRDPENNNLQNTNSIAAAGYQPENSHRILNKSGNMNLPTSLSKTNNQILMFSPNDGYHFVAPVPTTERPLYTDQEVQITPQSHPITTPKVDIKTLINAVFQPQAPEPKQTVNSEDDYSSPFFYRPFTTRAPLPISNLLDEKPMEPFRNSQSNFPSPPTLTLRPPFMTQFNLTSSVLPSAFSMPSGVPLSTTASPLSFSNNSSSSANSKESPEIVPDKSNSPLPLPLTTVLPTDKMHSRTDYEDYIPPRFFNY